MRSLQSDLAHVARLSTMGEMASALAHELNSPLSAIANYAEGSISRLRSGDLDADELVQVLERIASTALRAGTTIRRIRGFVKKREFEVVPVDVNQLVREVVSLLAGEARSAAIVIQLALADSLPPAVADPIQVQQVLVNLVRNGFEAIIDAQSAQRLIQIETGLATPNDLVVRVRDTGPGVRSDAADQLFAPFWTTKVKGLGLGLSISRSIIEAHGGALSVVADDGRGTTFQFTLPAITDCDRDP